MPAAELPALAAARVVTVSFAPQAAEINDATRNALDALAGSLAQRDATQGELRR